MKKLVILAALMAATTCTKAQVSDTITLSDVARTNAEIVRLNKAYNMHAAMVGVGGAVMIVGSLISIQGVSKAELGDASGANLAKVGAWVSIAGAAFIAASFIPLPSAVRVDERGLVVDLPTNKKKR